MTFLSRTYAGWLVLVAAAASAGLAGCSKGGATGPSPEDAPTDFISGNPSGSDDREGEDGGSVVAAGSTGSGDSAGAPDEGADDDPERAITEADIIQVKDGKLYALSQYAGLSVIDISRRDRLSLLGRYRASGMPFEMYLRDGIVYAMFSSWTQYLYDADTGEYTYEESSRIEALDVSDPSDIRLIGSFDLPGTLSDSRIVGDVLYAVTFENNSCWGCGSSPNTTVTSLAVGDPAEISVVDKLSYKDDDPYGYGWRRSVSVTQDRMYVAGIEWNGSDDEGHSTIQVIDISDPGGDLVEGTSVEAVGQIQSRWQMDEHEGVLRVVSQPGTWWNNAALPGVQTFTVASSQELTPLGYTELTLPRPESLRSVRFDGDRAYAITAEQTDPLFTIDLSDPEHPAQLGELEMPGWVYHMEPRGDRLLALGFDNASDEGSLHVSLFDVSDLTTPTMLERIHFGGSWGNFAEDQDRIHKAFTILDDLGTILVPYSGFEVNDDKGCGSYQSGIQLIDFTTDTLTKRGSAPARGQARRAFVHDERLFAVSDQEVGTFNIDDRGAPVEVTDLSLATIVSNAVATGDLVVRMSADWWTSGPQLEVVSAADPARTEPIGKLDLAALTSASDVECYGSGIADARLFAHGQYATLLWPSYADWTKTHLAVIDLRDPESPRIASQRELPFSSRALYWYGYSVAVIPTGDSVVQAGSTLVIRNASEEYYYYDENGAQQPAPAETTLEVLDLSNPSNPVHRSVALPSGAGYTGLQIDGTTVLTSHWVPLPEDPFRARFYLDRIDVSDPSSPAVLTPVNVPGSLLAFDGTNRRALTIDYEMVEFEVPNYQACYSEFAQNTGFQPIDQENWEGPGICRGMRRALKLLDVGSETARLRDESPIDDDTGIWQVLVGDDRVFMYTYVNYAVPNGESPYGITVASGLEEGSIELVTKPIPELSNASPVLADGTRLLVSGYSPPSLAVLDASDLDELTYETKAELSSYVYRVTLDGDRALCSLGHHGLEVVDLGN
ncbi:beta-propeller domain-containing protein [Sorangium sp. So ce887]|uniref:beta-propeller domain-containing protein n=1 Tax=Sorangium sp. So ce887 TaxID=3133324 RepID=UPI003F63F351